MFSLSLSFFYSTLYAILLVFENNTIFVYLYAAFTFGTTTLNYILLYISIRKVRNMAEKQF